jgi:nucleoid DNA-binding protein
LNLETLAKPLGSSVGKLGAAVGQQVSQVVDTVGRSSPAAVICSDIERYLLESPSWYLQPENLDRGFREVLFDPDADAALIRQQLEPIGRDYFAEVLSHRDGINSEQIQDIADELEVIRLEVLDQVRSAEEESKIHALRHQVEAYLHSAPKDSLLAAESLEQDFIGLLADPEAAYELLGNRLVQFDRDTLMQLLLAGRQDLSPEETEQILNHLEGARDRFLNQSQESWNQLQTRTDEFQQRVESYLRETHPAELTIDTIQQVFHNFSSVPEIGSLAVRMGLGQFDRQRLQQILAERQDINPDRVNQLLNQVESIRDRLLHAPQELTGQAKEQLTQVTDRIAEYLRNTQLEELNPEGIRRDLQQLFDDPQSGFSALGARLSQVDRETLVKLLSQRQDLSEEQVNQVVDQVQATLQSIVRLPRQLATRTRERIEDLSADFANYLRNTKREELNPEGIQRDLQRLFQRPREGAEQLRERLSHIDRDTIVALLAQREDLSEEEANRIVDQVLGQVESIRDRIVQQAQVIKEQVQATAAEANENVRGYLNSLDRPELNYEGIQRDIRKLFADPEAGFEALRDRLGQFDRKTLVAILSSRSDISEEQANKIVDQIEVARDSVLSRAQRIQSKAEERIQSLKHQAKAQAEEVQKISAATAWWVFGTALSSMATAVIAGVLAARY